MASGSILQYVYVPHSDSKPYFDMAHEWVLADRMFQSQLDESFVAHQYIIAAQADSSVDLPTGDWGCGGGKVDDVPTITADRNPNGPNIHPCFDYQTLGDELDKAKLSWRFYASAYGSASSGRRGCGRVIRPSSTSTTGPIGRKTSSRRIGSSSPTSAPGNSRTLPGSRRFATTPIM